jgi:hypothetical protein
MLRKSNVLATVLALAVMGCTLTTVAATPSRHIDAADMWTQVPVQARVPVSTATIGPLFAQAKAPAAAPGKGCGTLIPPLAAALDELLPTAQLSAVDLNKVTMLRELIRELSANGKEASARDVEEVAMKLLGYQKLWLRCGFGTFNWINLAGGSEGGQAQ